MANEFIIKNGFHSKGNSQVTGALILSGSGAKLNVSGSTGVLLENNIKQKFEIKSRYDDGESPASEQSIFSILNPGVNSTNIVLGQTGSFGNTTFYNGIFTLNLWPEWNNGALVFGTNKIDGNSFDSASIQFGNNQPTSTTGLGVDLGIDSKRLRNIYAFNFTGSRIDVESITGSFSGDGSGLSGVDAFPYIGDAQITGSLILSGSLLNTGTVSIDNTDSPYTITGTQQFILIDPSGGDITVNMPVAATHPGRQIFFKLTKAAAPFTLTLQRQGSDTIDGATTYTDLDIQYESISTVSNGGTGWFIF